MASTQYCRSFCALILLLLPNIGLADAPSWGFLDRSHVGADPWLKAHPTWDGRDAVIAVLDTGVDMGIAGLKETSTNKPKVIAVRDFSRQGDVQLLDARPKTVDGTQYLATDDGMVSGYQTLPKASEGVPYFLGWFDEDRLTNSSVNDVNLNGSTKDRFAIVTVETDKGILAYVDLDGDDDISDAVRIDSYDVSQQTFTFPRRSPDSTRAPLTFALHIDESGTQVSFHFDDGGHGTHVAGIAAGYKLGGRDDLHGIAPGAQILSLKIGDNTLSGGATTTDSMREAIEFAGQWSVNHSQHVIMNISYGIGSEIEGESDIDVALDEALTKYPLLHASVSAGNEGPGLSSVGTPGASALCTSVAAMLPKRSASLLYDAALDQDRIFAFSSRGGELDKPDLLAPGTASSSIPNHSDRDVKAGTSMAAPQIAGAYALLASAAKATGLRTNGMTLKRALIHSARLIDGYSILAQGAGLPNIKRAFVALRRLAESREPFDVSGYTVRTTVPTSISGKSRAAYWRTGTYLPAKTKGHTFQIEAVHPEDTSAEQRASLQEILTFRSEATWLKLARKAARIQGDNTTTLRVFYDATKLKKPGVYAARIFATPEDAAQIPAFALWNTVVVPWVFEHKSSYGRDWQRKTLKPGAIHRYPILVPPGATTLNVGLSTPGKTYGNTVLYLLDPAGHEVPLRSRVASSERGLTATGMVTGNRLTPGIWEAITYASFRNRQRSYYDLSVRFRSLEASTIRSWDTAAGRAPSGTFNVTNRFDTRFSGAVDGKLFGYYRERTLTAETDKTEIAVPMNPELERVDFEFRLDPTTYNRFTDIAISVRDEMGESVVESGFGNGVAHITVHNPGGSHELTLLIQGAFARGDHDKPWSIGVRETWVRKKQVPIEVGETTLFPQVRESLSFQLAETPPAAPKGYVNYGEIVFRDAQSQELWLKLPLKIQ